MIGLKYDFLNVIVTCVMKKMNSMTLKMYEYYKLIKSITQFIINKSVNVFHIQIYMVCIIHKINNILLLPLNTNEHDLRLAIY